MSASAPQMLAIDDFGSPSRRASSLGPAASPAVLGEQVEDRRRPGDGRGERLALGAPFHRSLGAASVIVVSPPLARVVGQPAEPRAVS